MIKEITVHELKEMKDKHEPFFLLDVREQDEYDTCHLNGHHIPLKELPERMNELDPQKKIIIHCRGGGRSSRAVSFLEQQGFHDVYNLKGGISAWWREIDTNMKQY